MDIEEITRAFKSIGISSEKAREDLIQLASNIALTFSEAINAICLVMSGTIELIKKIDIEPNKKYKRVLNIQIRKNILLSKKMDFYFHRGNR